MAMSMLIIVGIETSRVSRHSEDAADAFCVGGERGVERGNGMTQPAKRSAKAEILKLPISSRKEVAVGRVAAATS